MSPACADSHTRARVLKRDLIMQHFAFCSSSAVKSFQATFSFLSSPSSFFFFFLVPLCRPFLSENYAHTHTHRGRKRSLINQEFIGHFNESDLRSSRGIVFSLFFFFLVSVTFFDRQSCTSRIVCPKIAIFPQFQVCSSINQARQIINLLLLKNSNHFNRVISH